MTSAMPFQGGFQLFFEARDDDAGVSGADHLEDIFINLSLPVDGFVSNIYNGNRVTVNMYFFVNCQDDYYGRDCSTFCVPQNNQNGHYTCDEDDGSIICLPNYYGPECRTFCRASQSEEDGFYTCDEDDGSLICLPNYYGPECRTFCRASQSEGDGFYTCNEDDGSRICLPDYYGPECRTHCRPDEFYTCDEDDGSVVCREGFTRPQELCTESKCRHCSF